MGQITYPPRQSMGRAPQAQVRKEPQKQNQKLGRRPNLRLTSPSLKLRTILRKENAMNAPELMLALFVLRLILPFGLLLLIGERMRRRERARFYKMRGDV